MKTSKLFLMITAAVVSVTGCSEAGKYEMPAVQFSEGEKAQIQKLNDNSIDLFNAIKDGKETPVFISPLSMIMDMGQLVNVSIKDYSDLLAFTNSTSVEEMNNLFAKVMASTQYKKKGVDFTINNAVFFNSLYQVPAIGKKAVEEYYNSETFVRDFTKSQAVSSEISDWIRKKTKDVLEVDNLTIEKDWQSYVVNALYFRGSWAKKFESKSTKTEDFAGVTGNRKVPMMHNCGKYNYCEYGGFEAIELPYGNGDYSMIVMMSKSKDRLSPEIMNYITSSMTMIPLTLGLPKFETETNISEFPISSAKFDSFRHVAKINVDEEGAEAAAVTLIGFGSAEFSKGLVFNQPFYYVITQKTTGIILFVGYYC